MSKCGNGGSRCSYLDKTCIRRTCSISCVGRAITDRLSSTESCRLDELRCLAWCSPKVGDLVQTSPRRKLHRWTDSGERMETAEEKQHRSDFTYTYATRRVEPTTGYAVAISERSLYAECKVKWEEDTGIQ